ncbi:exonuclease domain-containing protein [Desulfobacula sp.]
MKTFLFYDVETSGLNPAFDQILTFASIRTDLELHEIKRQTITISLRNDIVPAPMAFLTHGLTYDELALGINEYTAALKIHKIVNAPDTISIGYNSLGFDDEFLRFLFYRNLLDPYTHQYANGCARMDILPVTALFNVFHPSCLNWPQRDGKLSLKLDLIARENKFVTTGRAHEALNDVEALIELSKRLAAQKDIWEYCLDFFNKTRDEVRINNIDKTLTIQNQRFKVCLMVSASFGPKTNYMAPVVCLGSSMAYKNQSLWLRLDSDDILGMNQNRAINDTFVIRKRPADALIVLPPLERFWDKLPKESKALAHLNMEKICHLHERFFEFIRYQREYKYPFIPEMDPDAALYQEGFFSFQEKRDIRIFHESINQLDLDRQKTIQKIKSPRIKILGKRILARNFKDTQGQLEKAEFCLYVNRLKSSHKKDQIIGYKNDTKYTCRQGLQELEEIQKSLLNPDQDQKNLLEWLKKYMGSL